MSERRRSSNRNHGEEGRDQGRLWSRLVRVESTVESLSDTVSNFIESTEKRDREMYDRFDRLQRELASSQRTNWPVLIGAGSMALVFAGMMAGLVMFSVQATVQPMQVHVQNQQARVDRQQDRIEQIPAMRARLELLERISLDPLIRSAPQRPTVPGQQPPTSP